VYKNQAGEVLSPVEPSLSSHPTPRCNVTCAHGWQNGGGIYISYDSGGTATLTDTNVYENQADVCSPVEPCLSSHPGAPLESHVCSWCAHGWQGGRGIEITSTGTAALTDTNVYENRADDVCSRLLNLS